MILLAAALVVTSPASGSPYRVSWLADGSATFGLFALTALSESFVKPALDGGISCADRLPNGRCDPAGLSRLDRSVVGRHDARWLQASDAGAALAYLLPLGAEALDVWLAGDPTPVATWGADILVIAESVAIATAATHVLKFAVRRPRPTQYREGAYVGSVEHRLSFPSGHTSSAAAAATAYAFTFALRHPDSPWRYAVGAAAAVVTAFTGYGRIGGGMHFYSDVFAGAILGATAGIVVPALHRRELGAAPLVSQSDRGAVRGLVLRWSY